MGYQDEKTINCSEFEEHLSDYLDKNLDSHLHKQVAAHALRCPLCHSLLNEVKDALEVCHEISAPNAVPMTRLEARILAMTMPETAMPCEDFERYLTDYLDGFLPAPIFHRWERHQVLCEKCTDLPGMVVRSIAACYTFKIEELPVPDGLHSRILQATLGTIRAGEIKPSLIRQIKEWLENLKMPISAPQLTPVAMMLLLVALIVSQTAMAENNNGNFYQKSIELAEQTYQQGADIVTGNANGEEKPAATTPEQNQNREPVEGTFVNQSK